ncbi:MAG: MFS transporter [Ectothiorhodospiraceae bacterium]
MKPVSATSFAVLGAGLIAIAFGLARYAFGLFVPAIRTTLDLSADQVGIVGSLAFISFCLASVVAPLIADRLGPRYTATLSGALAVVGLTLISQATDAIVLGIGIFACGVCTGLMMPALSSGVQVAVRSDLRGRVNAVMNAGTSAGLIVCVPTVLLLSDAWRMAYGSFAVLAALGVAAALFLIPANAPRHDAHPPPKPPVAASQWRQVAHLTVFCFAMGLAATAYWIFTPDLIVNVGGLPERLTGYLWLMIGVTGLAGAWASDLGDRIGAHVTQALALVGLAVATVLVALAPGQLWLAIISAGIFGWAFMTLSGLYLVTGIRLLRERPAMGPVVPFLAITVGQSVGSPLVGWTIAGIGHVQAFMVFAIVTLLIAAASPFFPRPSPDHVVESERSSPLTGPTAPAHEAGVQPAKPDSPNAPT